MAVALLVSLFLVIEEQVVMPMVAMDWGVGLTLKSVMKSPMIKRELINNTPTTRPLARLRRDFPILGVPRPPRRGDEIGLDCLFGRLMGI